MENGRNGHNSSFPMSWPISRARPKQGLITQKGIWPTKRAWARVKALNRDVGGVWALFHLLLPAGTQQAIKVNGEEHCNFKNLKIGSWNVEGLIDLKEY